MLVSTSRLPSSSFALVLLLHRHSPSPASPTPSIHCHCSDAARVLGSQSESVRAADGVVVATPVLPEVGRVLLLPCLGVQTAVGPLRFVVLAQEVDVVEVAGVVRPVGPGVAPVVRCVGLAGPRALTSVIRPGVELLPDVTVGCVDGAAERVRAGEARLRVGGVVLRVAIGTSNHDVKVAAVLASVLRRLRRHGGAPECALDVGERGRLGACLGWSQGGVPLKVNVEPAAQVGSIAELLALDRVVCLEGVETQVRVQRNRGLFVREGERVALRGWGTRGSILKKQSVFDSSN